MAFEIPAPDRLAAFERELARAMAELQAKLAAHVGIAHIDEAEWELDQHAGTIIVTDRRRGTTATAPVQIIGTYNRDGGTWLWAWKNPSIVGGLTSDAVKLRAYGRGEGYTPLTTAELRCSETDAWELAALAAMVCRRQGAYRGTAGSTLVFVTFGEVTLTAHSRKADPGDRARSAAVKVERSAMADRGHPESGTEERERDVDHQMLAAKAIGPFDRFILGLGWLWSWTGAFFSLFCTVGFVFALDDLRYMWRNEPTPVDANQAMLADESDYLALSAVLDRSRTIEFTATLGQRAFTVTPVVGHEQTLFVHERGSALTAAGPEPVALYLGRVQPRETGVWRVDGKSLRLDEEFRRRHRLTVSPQARVLLTGEDPASKRWLFTAFMAAIALGGLHVIQRLVRAVRFASRPTLVAEWLQRAAEASAPTITRRRSGRRRGGR